jgi:hypothetical protein
MSDTQPSGQPCSVAIDPSKLPPAQQLVLLTLRRCTLSIAVVRKLEHSTVRAAMADYRALVALGLARRGPDRWHRLTGLGTMLSGALARDLAREFGIAIPALSGPRAGYERQVYSQSGAW